MPTVLVFEFRHAFGLYGASQDHARAVRIGPGLTQRLVDGEQVMAVDDQGPGAERLDPRRVALEIPFQLGGTALAEPVDVDDGGEVAQLVVAGFVQRLPHRALSGLAVSTEHPGVIVQLVQVAARQAHPNRIGQALAQ